MSNTSNRYPQELKERSIRLVGEVRDQYGSEGEAIESVASKLGIAAGGVGKLGAGGRGLRRAQEHPGGGGWPGNPRGGVGGGGGGHRQGPGGGAGGPGG